VAEIISFRKAKKVKRRAKQEAQAAENRVKFGRTKAERQAAEAAARLAERKLEGHRREGGEDDE
jgi:Domain of unknown function (DUF4169)